MLSESDPSQVPSTEQPAEASPKAAGDSDSSFSSGIRIYLVEDYYLLRMGLVSALSQFDNITIVGEAESAEDALVDLETTEVDVLVLDLGLPGMNGIEMAQKVHQTWPDTHIIILTSHNQPEEIMAALGAGAQAYALKDIKPERLAQVIETVYDGAAWLDPAIASLVLGTLVPGGGQGAMSVKLGSSSGAESDLSSVPDTVLGVPKGDMLELTERERDVLELIVQGRNNQEISEALHISIHTTKAHVGNILSKLCVNDRVQAAIKAIKEQLV